MAKFIATRSVDFDNFDLNFYARKFTGSDFKNDLNRTIDGKTIADWYVMAGAENGVNTFLFAAGPKLSVNVAGAPKSGIVTMFAEADITGVPLTFMSGVALNFTDIYKAIQTATKTDDTTLHAKALSGNDRLLLSEFGDRANGYGGNDKIFGFGGSDYLRGNAGDDTITGGTGSDVLVGGAGSDKYAYNAPDEGGDIILTFAAADYFRFKGASFGLTYKGALKAQNFWKNDTGLAHDASDRFIFNTTDDSLWFDSDGTGPAAATQIADLSNKFPSMSAADILVV